MYCYFPATAGKSAKPSLSNYETTWFKSFMSNSRRDSVCFPAAISGLLESLFVCSEVFSNFSARTRPSGNVQIMTCIDICVAYCSTDQKKQNRCHQWKTPDSLRPKDGRMLLSKVTAVIICFLRVLYKVKRNDLCGSHVCPSVCLSSSITACTTGEIFLKFNKRSFH
jgi:hypothetical protein